MALRRVAGDERRHGVAVAHGELAEARGEAVGVLLGLADRPLHSLVLQDLGLAPVLGELVEARPHDVREAPRRPPHGRGDCGGPQERAGGRERTAGK